MTWPNVVSLLSVVVALVLSAMALIGGRSKDRVSRNDAEWNRMKRHQRVLEDYVYDLRKLLDSHGIEVPEWPRELRDGNGNGGPGG